MSTRALLDTFTAWQAEARDMVLITVVETAGSTYSKTGRHILMQSDGTHAGLVSGGCLEGDLASHAQQVLASGEAKLVTYDMRDDADDLWGIGLGCNGLMVLLVQKLEAANDWQPFSDIAKALANTTPTRVSMVTSAAANDIAIGDCHIGGDANWPDDVDSVSWTVQPWVRLLVLGAAPDAVPVVKLAREVGWEITLADHREHYLQANDFSTADHIAQVTPGQLDTTLDLNSFDAIVVMSHHLETDRKYLQQLAAADAVYVGLLGPVARRNKLLSQLDDAGNLLDERLHGPVGLDIAADSPETIALALIAEIQAVVSAHTKTDA